MFMAGGGWGKNYLTSGKEVPAFFVGFQTVKYPPRFFAAALSHDHLFICLCDYVTYSEFVFSFVSRDVMQEGGGKSGESCRRDGMNMYIHI